MTKAQELGITEFPYIEYDDNDNIIYYENSDGYWAKREYDDNGNQIHYENSNGYWYKQEYDDKGKEIHFENSNGYWDKQEYDDKGNLIHYEDSNGYIIDNRPKNVILSMDDIANKFGVSVSNLQIKK